MSCHWNQSLDPKHAPIALKEVDIRNSGLLMGVGRYNSFSREIKWNAESRCHHYYPCNLCLTWFWKIESVHYTHASFYFQDEIFLYLLQIEGKNKTYSYYLYDFIHFLGKKNPFQSRDYIVKIQILVLAVLIKNKAKQWFPNIKSSLYITHQQPELSFL